MALGEEVGDAYIEVHADARPFRRELKRDARRAGREAGTALGEDMRKGVDDELDETFSNLGRRIRAGVTRSGFRAGEAFGENLQLGVQKRLKKWNLDIGEGLLSGDFTKAAAAFDDLDTAVARIDKRLVSLRQGGRLTKDEFLDGRAALQAWGAAIRDGKVREELEAAEDAAHKLNVEMNKRESTIRQRELRTELQGIVKDLKATEAAYDRSEATAHRMNAAMKKAADDEHALALRRNADIDMNDRAHRRFTEDAIKDREDYFRSEIDGWLKTRKAAVAFEKGTASGLRALTRYFKANPVAGPDAIDEEGWRRALARVETNTDTVVTRMGRRSNTGMLGSLRGARNNFLNLVGILGGSIENVVGRGIDRVFDGIGGGITRLGDKLTDLGGGSGPLAAVGNGISTLGDKLTGLGKGGLDGFIVQIAIIISSLTVFMALIGPLVAGLSGLIGIATALAVTIGGALLGAIGSLLPIIAALGVFAGAAVVGFMGMTDSMKKMLKPLEDWFDATKKAVAENLFGNLEAQVEGFTSFLNSSLSPALDIGATALREFADGFLDMLNSPGVQTSMRVFRANLPTILENLGRTFNGVFASITGIISAAAPVVANFTDLIADVTEEFAKWSNSDKGRAEIRDFFEKAAVAAETLFEIVGELGGIIGKLWEEGSDTGQKFLDSFENALEVFNDWLGTKEGREQLSDWFEFAEDVAGKLADIIGELGELWKKLDTPENRGIFLALLGIVENLIEVLGWFADRADDLWDTLRKLASIIEIVVTWFNNLKTAIDEFFDIDWAAVGNTITQPFEDAWTWISEWFTRTKEDIEQRFHDLFDIDWQAVGMTIITGLVSGLFGLPLALLTVFVMAWQGVLAYITGIAATIISFVMTLPMRIAGALSALPGIIISVFQIAWSSALATVMGIGSQILAFIMSIPGRIGGALGSLAGIVIGAFTTAWSRALQTVMQIGSQILAFIMSIPGRVGGALGALPGIIGAAFSNAWSAAARATSTGIGSVVAAIAQLPSRAAGALGNLGRVLYGKGVQLVQGLIDGAMSIIGNLGSAIGGAISRIKLPTLKMPPIQMPSIPNIFAGLPFTATGGVFNGAQPRIIGEAGAEAVVPLNRPLSQVDPSVRALSAFAQGMDMPAGESPSGGGDGSVDLSESSIQALAAVVIRAATLIAQGIQEQQRRSDNAVSTARPRSY